MSSGRSVPWMPTTPPPGQSLSAAYAEVPNARPVRRSTANRLRTQTRPAGVGVDARPTPIRDDQTRRPRS